MVGTLIWLPVYFGLRPIVRRVRPAFEALSTHKLSTAALLSPLNILAWAVLAGLLFGWFWGGVLALAAVPLGLAAIGWHDRWARVRDDVGLFFRVAFRSDRREHLGRMRAELVRELDEIGVALEEEGAPRREDG